MTMLENSAAWRAEREAAFHADVPSSLGELLARAVRKHGDGVAIDLFERDTRLTFAEWDDWAGRLADGLRHYGVTKGSHVGVLFENVVEFPVTWLALARLGAVMVPMNPRYTPTELAYVIGDARISQLVAGRSRLARSKR